MRASCLGGSHTPGSIGIGEISESFDGSHSGSPRSGQISRELDAILQRLPGDFTFEGETFRVVHPEDRGQTGVSLRYEIVARERARDILLRKATTEPNGRTDPEALLAVVRLIEDSRFAADAVPLLLRLRPSISDSPANPRADPEPPVPRKRKQDPEPIERVNPEIIGAPDELDTSDDGFVPEPEPSDDEVDSHAANESDESDNVDESLA